MADDTGTQRVASTAISFVNYDFDRGVLSITFTSGARYNYFGVPKYTYVALMQSGSRGRFFNQAIRNSFPFSRG
jgi:hypothetical protein